MMVIVVLTTVVPSVDSSEEAPASRRLRRRPLRRGRLVRPIRSRPVHLGVQGARTVLRRAQVRAPERTTVATAAETLRQMLCHHPPAAA